MGGGLSKSQAKSKPKETERNASEKYLADKQNEENEKQTPMSITITQRKSTMPKQDIRRISVDLSSKSYITELQSIRGYIQFTVKEIVNVDSMDDFVQKFGYFSLVYTEDTFMSEKVNSAGKWNELYSIIIKKEGTVVYLRCGDKDMDQLLGRGQINLQDYCDGKAVDVYIPLDERKDCSSQPVSGVVCIKVSLQYMKRDELYRKFYSALLDIYSDKDSLSDLEVVSILDEIGHSLSDEALQKRIGELKETNSLITKTAFLDYLLSPGFISEPMAYSMLSYVLYGSTDVYNMLSSLYNTLDDETNKHITIGECNPQEQIDTIYYRDRDSCLTAIEYIPRYMTMIYHLLHSFNHENANIQQIYSIINQLTTCEGLHYSSPQSVKYIKPFIEKYNIPTDCWTEPIEHFTTFNQFLARKIQPEFRQLEVAKDDTGIFSCPADSKVTVFSSVSDAVSIWIKGSQFTIQSLLGERANDLAPLLDGCSIVMNRLSLQDYHHFHYPVCGKLIRKTTISGTLEPLHPLYIRTPNANPFTTNTRHILEIETPAFGLVVMIPVGSSLFGSIEYVEDFVPGKEIFMGDDCGFFKYGGSAILTLIPKDKIRFDTDLLENTTKLIETLVLCNKKIGLSVKLDDAN